VYPDVEVAKTVEGEFVPVRIHVKEQPKEFERFGAEWTPTIIVLDPANRAERHRIEGFLPKDEFLAHLALARGQFAFGRQQWDDAERRFRQAADKYAKTDAAPEGVYWAGVSKYKRTNDPAALKETWAALQERHPDSIWVKKASVWSG
jgi:hypothetical protein